MFRDGTGLSSVLGRAPEESFPITLGSFANIGRQEPHRHNVDKALPHMKNPASQLNVNIIPSPEQEVRGSNVCLELREIWALFLAQPTRTPEQEVRGSHVWS